MRPCQEFATIAASNRQDLADLERSMGAICFQKVNKGEIIAGSCKKSRGMGAIRWAGHSGAPLPELPKGGPFCWSLGANRGKTTANP